MLKKVKDNSGDSQRWDRYMRCLLVKLHFENFDYSKIAMIF